MLFNTKSYQHFDNYSIFNAQVLILQVQIKTENDFDSIYSDEK